MPKEVIGTTLKILTRKKRQFKQRQQGTRWQTRPVVPLPEACNNKKGNYVGTNNDNENGDFHDEVDKT